MLRTAEVAVFVTRRGGAEVLLLHRSPVQGGYWHVVAGGVESGESAAEAAARELLEETGLAAEVEPGLGTTELAYALSQEPAERRAMYEPGIESVHVDCFVVEAPGGWEPTLDWEHDGHRWCSRDEAVRTLRWPATAQALERLLP